MWWWRRHPSVGFELDTGCRRVVHFANTRAEAPLKDLQDQMTFWMGMLPAAGGNELLFADCGLF